MGNVLKSKLFRAAAIAAVLVGLYAALGFYAAPKLIRSKAVEFVQEQYGRELAIGEVCFNPFKLQLEIRDVAFPDSDRQTMLGFKRLFIDFEVSSLWHRAYTFRNVSLESPVFRTVIRPDSSVNLADLAAEETAPPPVQEPADTGLPAVWIQSFVVSDGRADYIDQARRAVFERRFAPITFTLQDFRTTPHGGDFGLAASSQQEERFEWKGRFALEPGISSQGEFTIANLRAPGVAEFLGDALPFGLTDGLIKLAGHYQVTLGKTNDVRLELPAIELSGLALRAKGADADWVQIPSLILRNTRVALPGQTVSIANVALSSLTAKAWKAADGSINLTRLFAPEQPATAASQAPTDPQPGTAAIAPTAAKPAATPAPSARPWQVEVGGVDVTNATIEFEDRSLSPAGQFTMAPLNVSVQDVSLDLGKALPLRFDTTINGTGKLTGTGSLTPEPFAADIEMDLAGFDLRDIQAYVGESTALTIERGSLAMKGKLAMTPPASAAADITFAGDVNVTAFKSVDNARRQDFFNFDRLELSKLRYDKGPDALAIDRIRIVKPFNRVFMGADQVLNVSAVLDPQGTAAALESRKAAAQPAAPVRKKSRGELRAEKKAAEAAAAARAHAPPAPAPDLEESGMPIRIRKLVVEGGRMDFADYGIQPNFAANIIDLNGQVTGMSSDPRARAKVDIKGRVGEFSPVTISGDVQPFAYDRFTDIGMKFENISLPIFNPYSGKFAGYSIAKGKLTTDLHYTVHDRSLEARHHIRIDQLEWGAATAGKTEATLPVKFATSLLKDADGVINLDIPLSGTLDDPKFRIGPIVWQVIKNILTKAVTAPFRALGALFKGSEESQFVDFAPGTATLDAATAERLAGLARALAPKSDIRLNVPIGSLAELDGASLAEQRYGNGLERAMRQVLHGRKADDDKPVPAFDTLDSDKKIAVLTVLVQQLSGAAPQMPPPPTPPEGTSRQDAKALYADASIEYLEKAARSRVMPDAAELDRLGESRADAVQKALLAGTGLDPQRVFVVKNGKVAAQDGKVRLELAME